MEKIDYDVVQARNVARGYPWTNRCDKTHGKVFFNSNENLDLLLSRFDFKDKDILSVLASSDQLFYFYNKGAKTVDTFDKNVLTIYYYYFRKWIIEFKNRYYPKRNITKRTIQRIISKVVPRSEEENNALMFWKKLYSGHFYSDFIDLFIEDPDLDKNIIKRSKEFRNRVINEDINFYNVDISEEFILDKKYDVIYTSNIHDYITYKPKIERYRDNVYDLLKPGGIVISSNLSHGVCNANELGLFSSKFNYEILDDNVGYVYKKKEGK